MTVISKTQLENASLDANSFQLFINGDDVTEVVTRLGRHYPTIAKFLKDTLNGGTLVDKTFYITPTDPDGTIAGIAGTTNGQVFRVPQSPDGGFIYYTNNSGVAVQIAYTPGNGDVKKLQQLVFTSDLNGVLWNFVDVDGMSVFTIKTDGSFGTMLNYISDNEISARNFNISVGGNGPLLTYSDFEGLRVIIVDENGVVAPNSFRNTPQLSFTYTDKGWIVLDDGEFQKVIVDSTGELKLPQWVLDMRGKEPDPYSKRNQSNLAYSERIRNTFDTKVKRLTKMINHIIWYGQSLSSNQEGWPALSKTPYANLDNYMVGNSSRGNSRTNPNFVPIGSPVLTPLKAVVQSADGSTILTDAQVAALSPGAVNEGEGGVACANMFKQLFLKQAQEDSDADRKIVLSNTGVNGRTIEQLSKGASPELYNRPREASALVKSLADTAGVNYGVLAIAWLQGEWNSLGSNGGTQDYQAYYDLMTTLFADMRSDFAYANGQTDVPAVFMYQTGGQYARDSNKLSIARAQLDFCRVSAGNHAYMFGPAYPYPDKGGHLTSNGYRWMDMQCAKVMFKVLVLGEGWEPLSPIGITCDGNEIVVDYHVPSPPLQFRTSYNGLAAFNSANRGFVVVDASGTVPLQSVDIVADTVISIKATRPIVLPVEVYYAGQTSNAGNGNVFDSDSTVATELYEYTAGSGQYAGENIAELVGKPYPLNNASVSWYIKLEA